ncbi:MAG: zinc ribbon domain-containing protein, partial [Actinobacteria bacterium]|nr:zinc ribbon domain-containing protein [Actinomycetota bacterium]
MVERGRPVHCAQCGSIVDAGDNFCGVCGARVSPPAQDASPTQEIPTQGYAPPRVSNSGTSRTLPLILGLAAVLLVLIGIGVIVGLALTGGDETNPQKASAKDPA